MNELIPKNKFYTPQEITNMKLSGLPCSIRAIGDLIKRENWQGQGVSMARKRSGRGGGWEYSPLLFPPTAQDDFVFKYFNDMDRKSRAKNPKFYIKIDAEKVRKLAFKNALAEAENTPQLPTEIEDRIRLLACVEDFKAQYNNGKSRVEAERIFCEMYNSGQADFEVVLQETIKSISVPTLKRWRKELKAGGHSKLAKKRGGRVGTSVLSTYHKGEIAEAIVGHIVRNQFIKTPEIRDYILADFGNILDVEGREVSMPSIRSFERFIANFKIERENALLKITDPDKYKNSKAFVGFNMNSHINYFNQKWEIDASPTDIITTEGRYNLYALIDIFSRRVMIHISKSASTEASLNLIRRAILEWGVPTEIATDNGTDFVSKRFKLALESVGVAQHVCAPFSPEQKGTVERVIGTINRSLMPTLSGFIGHNVADRKQIEARKSFSRRLGEGDAKAFGVDVTPEQLQEYCDSWANDKYAHKKHRGIGVTPFEKQQSCSKEIKIFKDERVLDLLLSPLASGDGFRTITKHGLRIDSEVYWGGLLVAGERVFVRHDPADAGRVFVYKDNKTDFICEAICPNLRGVDPKQLHKEIKAQQAENINREVAPLLRAARKIKSSDVAAKILSSHAENSKDVAAFPKREIAHDNENIETANDIAKGYVPVQKHDVKQAKIVDLAKVKSTKRGQKEITADYEKCIEVLRKIEAGLSVDETLSQWATRYQNSIDFKSEQKMAEWFGAANGN